jgi:PIN domain nuclease of toxin-antitoxin system
VRYLLDTCTFLWLAQQPGQLSASAIRAIDDPENELHVSDVSIWEIVLKHSAGRLPLPAAPRQWLPAKVSYHQLQRLGLDHVAIYRSGELPRLHPDPFDRLIAAQAIETGLTILSPDIPLSLLGASRVW